MEHHSNILHGRGLSERQGRSWSMPTRKTVVWIWGFREKLTDQAKFVSITHALTFSGWSILSRNSSIGPWKRCYYGSGGAQSVPMNWCSKIGANYLSFRVSRVDRQEMESCMEKSTISAKCHLLNLVGDVDFVYRTVRNLEDSLGNSKLGLQIWLVLLV